MFYNALATNPQTETVAVPFQVKGLALGDFIWDRDGRTEISVLAGDGSIHILQHGTLNTTPLTAADLPARQAAIRGHHKSAATPPDPTALGAWTVAKQLPYTGSAPSGPLSASAFNSPRLAESSTQDLMVIDAGRSQLNILDTSGTAASPSAGVSFTGTPVAALALPEKINAGRDLVVLAAGQAAPMVIPTNFYPSCVGTCFFVNTTADIDTINAHHQHHDSPTHTQFARGSLPGQQQRPIRQHHLSQPGHLRPHQPGNRRTPAGRDGYGYRRLL
jgi:hypothetical protein